MTKIRQSYQAAKYHKKITLLFFILFSLMLLALSFVSQLLTTQANSLDYITNKVDNFKKVFPQMNQSFSENLIESNQNVTNIYHTIYISILLGSLFIFLIFGFLAAKFRKSEIDSMQYMGIRKNTVVKHLLADLLIPISLSCSLMFLFLLICSQQVINQSVTVNSKVVGNYFEDHLVNQNKVEATTKQNITKTNTNQATTTSDSEAKETDKSLIPFNQLSLFEIDLNQQSSRSTFFTLFQDMILLGITSITGCFIGFYSYTSACFRRRSIA